MSDDELDPAAPKGAQSLGRAISVLRVVANAAPHPVRLAELIQGTGLSKATAHRLATTLVFETLLAYDPRERCYSLGGFFSKFVTGKAHVASHLPVAETGARPAAHPDRYSGSKIPLAHLLCDRHLAVKRAHPAMIHETVSGQTSELSFGKLAEYSSRFARVLAAAGIRKGDRVAVLLPKGMELVITALAIWRIGAVYMPLFSTYSPAAVEARLKAGGVKAVVANRFLIDRASRYINEKTFVCLIEGDQINRIDGKVTQFWSSIYASEPLEGVETYGANDPFIMTYAPSFVEARLGLLTPVRALAAIEQYMRIGMDVRDDDVYWNMADQGWEYGIYYGLIGPLLIGCSILFCDGPYDVSQGYRVLSKFRVTNLTAAPSQIKAWRRGDPNDATSPFAIRTVTVGGEPLPPDVISWVTQKLEVPLINQYGHRETGMIVGMKYDPRDPAASRRSSVGRVMPGFALAVLDKHGAELPAGAEGILAVDVERSPLFWFRSYFKDDARTRMRFEFGGDYYILGDTGFIDDEGWVHYSGRASHAILMQKD
ncbi:AMP-binding protein [Roseixanthobacter glucoisosaccharinicivorans]|uniref:AMP-binding protein n=1 Tax=Roseixanthobacter glucoisosaccharinicivorans TaxID=3119923 RepID=UPI003726D925